ncbi:flagellar export chaperone FliS [Novosphingobium sp.]|uniref:flagellar export chaperone FliS n=1 Tax=Novosphingobium sp. TaxID=1874826 RepID=UPI002733AD47|nr:flagellar protein FliS [Novosphingobium sp.]MDP3908403.1 flagellar protein FliS [Novosphingobium sp.]
MLMLRSPHEAYRKVDFDARVAGATPQPLVALCYEQLIGALGSAQFAHERGDNRLKSQSLTRAMSALTALQLGVSPEAAVGPALIQLYEAARRTVLDSVLSFNPAALQTIRSDFIDIARAMSGQVHNSDQSLQ